MTCAWCLAGALRPAPATSAGSPRAPEPHPGRSRARVSLLPALTLLLGALSLFHAAPAQAQSTVLLSNFEEAYNDYQSPDDLTKFAQGFTTGSYSGSYVLTSIDVLAFDVGTAQPAAINGELWLAAAGGGPGRKIATLSAPATVAKGPISFNAPPNTLLAARTTYYFVVSTDNSDYINITTTLSNAEESERTFGGSIENIYYHSSGNWDSNPSAGVLHIRVNGPLSVTRSTDPDLLTGLTVHDGTRELFIDANRADDLTGLGGPDAIYAVQVNPGIRSVTVTPTWANEGISGVVGSVRYVTYGTNGMQVSWTVTESGTGKEVSLVDPDLGAPGTTRLELELIVAEGEPYVVLFQHNFDWENANNRLGGLVMRASQSPQ